MHNARMHKLPRCTLVVYFRNSKPAAVSLNCYMCEIRCFHLDTLVPMKHLELNLCFRPKNKYHINVVLQILTPSVA